MVLIVLAWVVARSETPQMTIRPGRAAPGHTVTVEFRESHHLDGELTLERGDQMFLLAGDQLTELEAMPEPTPSSSLDRSSDEDARGRPDLASQLAAAIGLASFRDRMLLPSGFDDPHIAFVTRPMDLTDVTWPGSGSGSIWQLTLPYELERGTYRACTLPDETQGRVCAPLTVGFGD